MMVDTRVYGYVWEGFMECPPCTRVHADERSGALFDEAGNQASAIFSHEDDGFGWQCDTCGDDIFATWPEVAHREYGDHDEFEFMDPAACVECRDYFADHEQHANDAYNDGAERFEDWCEECGTIVTDSRDAHANGDHANAPWSWCPVCREALAREARTEELGL